MSENIIEQFDLSRGEKIGSDLFLCLLNDNGDMLVEREYLKADLERSKDDISRLRNVFPKIRHDNIVQHFTVQDYPSTIGVTSEFFAGGSIANILVKFGPLDTNTIRKYIRAVMSGLEHLHKQRLWHGNLKTSNMMVSIEGDVKITDMDCCHAIPQKRKPSKNDRILDIHALGAAVCTMGSADFSFEQSSDVVTVPDDLISLEAQDFVTLCYRGGTLETLKEHEFLVNDEDTVEESPVATSSNINPDAITQLNAIGDPSEPKQLTPMQKLFLRQHGGGSLAPDQPNKLSIPTIETQQHSEHQHQQEQQQQQQEPASAAKQSRGFFARLAEKVTPKQRKQQQQQQQHAEKHNNTNGSKWDVHTNLPNNAAKIINMTNNNTNTTLIEIAEAENEDTYGSEMYDFQNSPSGESNSDQSNIGRSRSQSRSRTGSHSGDVGKLQQHQQHQNNDNTPNNVKHISQQHHHIQNHSQNLSHSGNSQHHHHHHKYYEDQSNGDGEFLVENNNTPSEIGYGQQQQQQQYDSQVRQGSHTPVHKSHNNVHHQKFPQVNIGQGDPNRQRAVSEGIISNHNGLHTPGTRTPETQYFHQQPASVATTPHSHSQNTKQFPSTSTVPPIESPRIAHAPNDTSIAPKLAFFTLANGSRLLLMGADDKPLYYTRSVVIPAGADCGGLESSPTPALLRQKSDASRKSTHSGSSSFSPSAGFPRGRTTSKLPPLTLNTLSEFNPPPRVTPRTTSRFGTSQSHNNTPASSPNTVCTDNPTPLSGRSIKLTPLGIPSSPNHFRQGIPSSSSNPSPHPLTSSRSPIHRTRNNNSQQGKVPPKAIRNAKSVMPNSKRLKPPSSTNLITTSVMSTPANPKFAVSPIRHVPTLSNQNPSKPRLSSTYNNAADDDGDGRWACTSDNVWYWVQNSETKPIPHDLGTHLSLSSHSNANTPSSSELSAMNIRPKTSLPSITSARSTTSQNKKLSPLSKKQQILHGISSTSVNPMSTSPELNRGIRAKSEIRHIRRRGKWSDDDDEDDGEIDESEHSKFNNNNNNNHTSTNLGHLSSKVDVKIKLAKLNLGSNDTHQSQVEEAASPQTDTLLDVDNLHLSSSHSNSNYYSSTRSSSRSKFNSSPSMTSIPMKTDDYDDRKGRRSQTRSNRSSRNSSAHSIKRTENPTYSASEQTKQKQPQQLQHSSNNTPSSNITEIEAEKSTTTTTRTSATIQKAKKDMMMKKKNTLVVVGSVRVIADYVGSDKEEISCSENAILEVLEARDDGWLMVRRKRNIKNDNDSSDIVYELGLVPCTYCEWI